MEGSSVTEDTYFVDYLAIKTTSFFIAGGIFLMTAEVVSYFWLKALLSSNLI